MSRPTCRATTVASMLTCLYLWQRMIRPVPRATRGDTDARPRGDTDFGGEMRPRVWAGLLLGTVTLSSATAAEAQGTTCRSDAHRLPTPLVGTWHEFTMAPAGLVFEGELKSSLEAGGCAFIQTFVSSDSTFTFRSLGYVDPEQNTWIEHFVLSDGRTATYQWEPDGADILLNRTEPVAGFFRLRVTDIQANSYVVIEERRTTDSAQWRQGERTLTRRVWEGGGAAP